MHAKGRSRRDVLAELETFLGKDSRYEDGMILSSMCTSPQAIAKTAYSRFIESNLGDPGLFTGSSELEKEVINQLLDLLNCPGGAGSIVSGGTEANLTALWAARNKANISNPEIIVPESAHFSFDKTCNILGLKLVRAKLDDSFRVAPQSVERLTSERTVAIVGTVGTSELGVVDPISMLSEIARRREIHLHVDAALGGLVIPFLDPEYQKKLAFDFQLDGVKSLTVDPHKMGMSTVPSGAILFRDQNILECIKTETPYLSENAQFTFSGTRSGAPAAATWAVFESLGREGFQKTVKRCINLAMWLSKRIEALELQLVVEPTLNIVAFRTPNSRQAVSNLRKKGWVISYVPRLDCIRIVIMPHVRRSHIKAFVADLSAVVHSTSRNA